MRKSRANPAVFATPVVVMVLAVCASAQHDWPQFRGERARGIATGFETPTKWDVEEGTNVSWRTPVPGLAHSSPVIWGDRLFVTTAVREGKAAELSSLYGSKGYGSIGSVKDDQAYGFRVYCLDKRSGKVLWTRTAHGGVPKVKRHPKSSHANPTPACTADRLVVSFGSEGFYCYDHEGELKWNRNLGVLNSGMPGHRDKSAAQWGFASSPIIHGQRVFLQCDHEGESFVAALRLEDGKDVWRTVREENSTWSTPTVHEESANGRPQLILNGYKHIGGYDLETGQEIWKLVGGGDIPIPTPVADDDLIFLSSAHGRSRPLRAVKVTASGELMNDPDKDDNLVWKQRRGVYHQSPVVHDGLLYACSDGGILACYDAKTGERKYRERLSSGPSGFSGSPVLADGKLYFSGESGEIFVVRVGPAFEVIATNDMGEPCMSTPAISEGRLYFRTRNHLVAIGEGTPHP